METINVITGNCYGCKKMNVRVDEKWSLCVQCFVASSEVFHETNRDSGNLQYMWGHAIG